MFSHEVLDSCTVIIIEKLMPRKLNLADSNSIVKDGFMFISRDSGGLKTYMNLGFEPTQAEKDALHNFLASWGGGEKSSVHNTILEMEFPEFVIPFYERINAIPGCRVDPNLFHSKGDIYVNVEYNKAVAKEVNDIITEFLIKDHLFSKRFIYSGPQGKGLPYLLQLFSRNGNSLGDFLVVKTAWRYDSEQIKRQNEGIVQNLGKYVPKEFSEGQIQKLIFKTEVPAIKGSARSEIVSMDDNLVEFQIKSKFFTDFSNEVIKRYTGPIFLQLEITLEKQISYYIVEKSLQIQFLKGITENWKKPARADHVNLIEEVVSLDEAT